MSNNQFLMAELQQVSSVKSMFAQSLIFTQSNFNDMVLKDYKITTIQE